MENLSSQENEEPFENEAQYVVEEEFAVASGKSLTLQ